MKNPEVLPGFFCLRPADGKILLAAAALTLAGPLPAADLAATNAAPDSGAVTNSSLASLSNMSIEQLMNVKVSILGPSQTVSRTPAAVSVVTAEDIRRSGAQNIPEALRLVPGMDVAQIDAAQWAVSVRGFNDQFADKLLVMEDGRSLYTPQFAGVVWDVQDTMMEDIDHIEVVRGPGETLWGANAMNGVINIITKNAADTQGWLVSGGGGNQDTAFGSARYGGKIGEDAYYRVYGAYNAHDNTDLTGGGDAHNSWQVGRGGVRTDWNPAPDNAFTFQGEGYAGGIDEMFAVFDPASPTLSDMIRDDMRVGGADALGRWTHTLSDTANFKVQAYYDFTTRDATGIFDEQRHTFDLTAQNEFAAGPRNQVIWGLGYRVTADTEKNFATYSFSPAAATLNLFSAFAQDQIALAPDRLSLTLGSKIEHNDYTGVEIEPGARLLWTPTPRQTFWASVSRAVRTPSRAEESILVRQAVPDPFPPPAPPYVATTLSGSTGFEPETMLAYELGYRAAPAKNLSLDAAAFYNDYNHLRSLEQNPVNPTQFVLANNLYGDSYGTELSATWRVTDWWRLQPAYTFLKMNLYARAGSTDTQDQSQIKGQSPENQFSLRSSWDLPGGVTADAALRYVDSLPAIAVGGYFELDARLAWQINRHWEIALVGQNLLHPLHQEFAPSELPIPPSAIPRSVYAKITWKF